MREKFDSFFRAGPDAGVREETPTSPMYFTQSFRDSGNNFYYLGILRIESREKKNEDRERNGGGLSYGIYRGRQRSRAAEVEG